MNMKLLKYVYLPVSCFNGISFRMKFIKVIILFLALALIHTGVKAETIYLTPQEALQLAFPSSTFTKETKKLTVEQKKSLEKEVGIKIPKLNWSFTIARSGENITGYALIDNEIGKTEPITFMTAMTKTGQVKAIEILVYRESYGSEVTQKSFLNQFKNKKTGDPLTLGKNIQNITGATLSSRAVTKGAKRALLLWKTFYQ